MEREPKPSRKVLTRLLFGIAGLLVLLEIPLLLNHSRHGYFKIDGWLAFYAIFGVIASGAVVFVGQLLANLLKRDPDFYGEEETTLPEDIDESIR